MFVKLTKSGPRSYVQLVQAYRDDAGRPKQRTVATLGRLDQIGESVKSMHDGLSRLLGLEPADPFGNGTPSFESSRALGDVWALTALWKELGLRSPRAGVIPSGPPPHQPRGLSAGVGARTTVRC